MTADELKVGDRVFIELYGHIDGGKYPCGGATVDRLFPMVGGGMTFSFQADVPFATSLGAQRSGIVMPDDGSVWVPLAA